MPLTSPEKSVWKRLVRLKNRTVSAQTGVRLNLVANFVGKAWVGLMGMLFLPLYIQRIGIEAYGLIGVYAALTAIIAVMDLGLTTTINREMARLSAADEATDEARNLLRTLEVVYWIIGAFVGLGLAALAPVLAHHWVHTQGISASVVQRAILIMAVLFAFQWPDSFYAGGLMGLQRQVLLNWVRVISATCAGGGALLVLWLISPTVVAYFVWQAIVCAVQTLLLAFLLWSALPKTEHPPRFQKQLWVKNWKFTGGVAAISITAVLLTQMDKIFLSRLLPLTMFGYYTLATALASNLAYPTAPIFTSVFPRLSQLVAIEDVSALTHLYHKSCQLLSVIILPIWVIVALFSKELLTLYLHDPVKVAHLHLLLSLLITGTALNSLVTLPYALQLAYGWTKPTLYQNAITLMLFIPLLYWMVGHYQALGAAWAWVIVNASYLVILIPVMHRRLLQGEMWRWYVQDVGQPLVICLIIGGLGRLALSGRESLLVTLLFIALPFLCALLCSAFAIPWMRASLRASVIRLLLRKSTAHA